MRILIFYGLLVLCGVNRLAGQEVKLGQIPAGKQASNILAPQSRQYVFKHFNSFNGLASNIVRYILQDRKGFIWVASIDGLQRYDGNVFRTFRHEPNNPRSLPSEAIMKLIEDNSGNLWLYTTNGKIGYFNTNDFTYTEVPVEGSKERPDWAVFAMEKEPGNRFIIYSGEKDFFTYNPAHGRFEQTGNFGPVSNRVVTSCFHDTASTKYWFSCLEGLVMYDTRTGNLNYEGHNPDQDQWVKAIGNVKNLIQFQVLQRKYCAYSTWDENVPGAPHTTIYNGKTGKAVKHSLGQLFGLGYFELGPAFQQRNGRLWIEGAGFLAEYTGGEKPYRLIRNSNEELGIKFDHILSMMEDREGNLWLATDNGVFHFNPDAQYFHSYTLIRPGESSGKEVETQAALQLENGDVFIGTWGCGLYYYDNNFNPLPLPAALKFMDKSYSIWCIYRHAPSGKIWFGLQNGGLVIYDPAAGKAEIIENSIFDRRTIRQMTGDSLGNIWLGTQAGKIIKWNYKQSGGDVHSAFQVVKKGDSAYIIKLFTDSDGFIWAGSVRKGLFKYDPVTNKLLRHFTSAGPGQEKIWYNSVTDIIQYNDSLLLVTSGAINVLNRYTSQIKIITSNDGLPGNNAMCLAKDRNNMLWVGMEHGLLRMNMEKNIFTRYDRRDGLIFDNFPAAGGYALPDGRMLFLTVHNFMVFNPEKVVGEPSPSIAYITDVKVQNNSLRLDSLQALRSIYLDHDQNTVLIEFSGLRYLWQNKIRYYYKMDGIDKDWVMADERRQAVYNYLPPGDHTFHVKTDNGNGVTGQETLLHFSVLPPFWKSWWFFGLLLLLVSAILYWLDRQRLSRMTALQQVRTQIASNLHEDINATLSNINLLSEMAKIKADKDINRSKEYIDQISDKSHNMINAMDDMLWSIDPANDNMEKTVLRMKELADTHASRHGTEIELLVDKQVKTLRPDMKIRHEFFLIFKEMLNAMVLCKEDCDILVQVDLVKGKLCLKVQGSGETSETSQPANSILQNMKKRAAHIRAILDIQKDARGISMILMIPVKK